MKPTNNMDRTPRLVGVDGCKYGWVAVSLEDEEARIFRTMGEVLFHFGPDDLFLVDMPIGLESENLKGRECETEARRILSIKRKPCVFTVPCREAVYSGSYGEVNKVNKKILSKGISKQAWNICPKIKELDQLLVGNINLRPRMMESHPEVSFHFLNGRTSMAFNKKSEQGQAERLGLLIRFNAGAEKIFDSALKLFRRKDVAKDDILDAICLAITLTGMHGTRTCLSVDERDEHEIGMKIHFFDSAQVYQ